MKWYDKRRALEGLGYTAAAAVVIAVLVGFGHRLLEVLDMPEVRESYRTGRCVEVVDHRARHEGRKSEWSCDNLPPEYDRVWVE